MPDFSVLILPLVGGYLILHKSILFRDGYKKISPQELIFHSIISGIFLLLATLIIRYIFFRYFLCELKIVYFKISQLPFYTKGLGTCFHSFLFSLIFVYVINLVYGRWLGYRFNHFVNAIIDYGDELEKIFLDSFQFGNLLQITLKNGKVYVGIAINIGEPQKTKYVEILPIASGYRETENKILWLTTEYEVVINAIINKKELPSNNFKIVMNQDEIIATSFFDPKIYNVFHEQRKKQKTTTLTLTPENKTAANKGFNAKAGDE